MYEYFKGHPEVFVPTIKEPHYFSYPEVASTYYDVHFSKTWGEYLNLYTNKGGLGSAGDFSPSYLHCTRAPDRIMKRLGFQTKIVVLLRDPVDRAISHYHMDVRLGYQRLSLMEVLANPSVHQDYYAEYVPLGFYAEGIHRYSRIFSKSNVGVFVLEDYVDSQGLFKAVCQFLAIPFLNIPLLRRNEYGVPLWGVTRLYREWPIAKRLYDNLPSPARRMMRDFFIDRHSTKPPMLEERMALSGMYEADIETVGSYLGRDLSQIWSQKGAP
jgi:hypothetical protein